MEPVILIFVAAHPEVPVAYYVVRDVIGELAILLMIRAFVLGAGNKRLAAV